MIDEDKLKKLIQEVRASLRLSIAFFLFVMGLYIGITQEVSHLIWGIINLSCILIGIIVVLAIILSELEEDE